MKFYSAVLLSIVVALFCGALAQNGPVFPIDSFMQATATGVVISPDPICGPAEGIVPGHASVKLGYDSVEGSFRLTFYCGDAESSLWVMCGNRPIVATSVCRQGNCSCTQVDPRYAKPTCPPIPFNSTMFQFTGMQSWYYSLAQQWRANWSAFPVFPQNYRYFIYTKDDVVIGMEVFTDRDTETPFQTYLFGSWDPEVPSKKDLTLPCAV